MTGTTLKDKICLITGATSGIGKVTALELAKMGATIVMNARDRKRGESTMAELMELSGNRSIELIMADLSSQKDIRALATEFKEKHDNLHILLNNAAIVPRKRTVTVDGIETQFAVNHLAYFLLTHLLLDVVKASTPSRIVNTSSEIHKMGKIHFDDLQSEKSYRGFGKYGHTKLMNFLFTYELARRLEGTGVTVNCFSPGFTATGLGRSSNRFSRSMMNAIAKSPEKGAVPLIYLASSPEVEGISGKFFSFKKKIMKTSKISYDKDTGDRLWKICEDMTGLTGFWDK